mgnify:FL=1
MKKKYITKLMIAACLSSALSLNSCIEEVFPESSTATIDQIGKSDQAISAMVNSVVAFINAFRSYGPQFYHDFGYSGYNLIRESACEDFFCHEPKFDFFLILMEYVMIWVMPMLSIPFGIITTSF